MSTESDRRRGDDRLLEVAAALADGRPVDAGATAGGDAQTSRIVRRLQSLERLSHAFRDVRSTDDGSRSDANATDAALFTWGHLVVRELIGTGGFGDVYRAWDPLLDREVALKLRRADPPSLPARDHEIEEARRLGRVRHPNVVTVHGVAVHDGVAGFWCDLIRGQTLEDLLTDRGPFGASEVVAIGADLCRGLSALHAAGIVHGDVKTTNVMREHGGRIVLMDLGAGRRAEVAPTGPIYGTRSTVAPEVFRGEPTSAASDVYAVGALLFRLLTASNYPGLDAGGPDSGDKTPTLRDLRPDVAPQVVSVVERALSADPASRFRSAGATGQALQRTAENSAGVVTLRHRSGDRTPLRRFTVAAVAAALVIITGAVFSLSDGVRPVQPGDQMLRIDGLRSVPIADGFGEQGALAPDGGRMAFVTGASGRAQLWVQDLPGGSARRLADVEVSLARPTWLPDGSRIVFTAGNSVWSVSPEGSAPAKLLDEAWNASVGRRSGRIVFERREEIWVAGSDGSNARKVEGIPSRAKRLAPRHPVLSPDESLIAFMHAEERPWGDLWVVPAAGGTARRVTAEGKAFGSPAWSPDGRTIVYPSRRTGGLTLWQVDVSRALEGGPQVPRSLLQSEGEDTAPTISNDGRTLLFTSNRSSFALVLLDPATGEERTLRQSPVHLMSPVFSNDGRRLAFFGWGHDGEVHVFTMGLDGGSVRQITSAAEGESTFPIWSADDRELFFYRATVEPSWRRVSATGGASVEVKAGWTASDRHMIDLDQTGSGAVYTWYEADVPRATRLLDLESGAEREFHQLLRYPSFSPDRQWIVGADAVRHPFSREGPLVACGIEAGPCRPLAPVATHSKVSADGRTVYFQRPSGSAHGCELWSVQMDGSGATRLHTFTTESPYLPAFDVASSGQIVLQRFEPGNHELWLADLHR